jgi:putative redox protein
MSDVAVTWVQGQQFVASGSGGHSIVLDAPNGRPAWQGFKPSELLLAALGGCTAVDVIDILRKKRQRVSGLRVSVRGEQHEEYPRPFERIAVHYARAGCLRNGGGAGDHPFRGEILLGGRHHSRRRQDYHIVHDR